MAVKPSMKTQLSLLYGKLEAVRGVDPLPVAEDDAMLVGDLDIQLDPTQLERNIFRTSFSPVAAGVGRKVVNVTFNAELKGAGSTDRPRLGALLRACAMRELLITPGAATQIETPVKYGKVKGPNVAWSKDAAPTLGFGSYRVEVVEGGASAAAAVQVSRWASGEEDLSVFPNTRVDARTNFTSLTTLTLDKSDLTSLEFTVGGTPTEGNDLYAVIGGVAFPYTVTGVDEAADTDTVATNLAALINADPRLSASATASVVTVTYTGNAAPITLTTATTAVPLGDSGAEITPTWAGDLKVGQAWIVTLYETGYTYRPTSKAKQTESMTFYVFKDGALHIVSSCTGTVTFTGEAGQIAQAAFEFQGNYAEPVEEPTPLDAEFEETEPPQVELAQMSIAGDNDFCAQSFTYALGNETNLKDCINAKDGFDGSQVTGRTPTAQLNPEASYEAYVGMWNNFSTAAQFPLHTRVGTELGNMIRFYAERANFTGLSYGDRNGAVTLECDFQLNGLAPAGDDELRIVFPA
jgi:hypothetical protein